MFVFSLLYLVQKGFEHSEIVGLIFVVIWCLRLLINNLQLFRDLVSLHQGQDKVLTVVVGMLIVLGLPTCLEVQDVVQTVNKHLHKLFALSNTSEILCQAYHHRSHDSYDPMKQWFVTILRIFWLVLLFFNFCHFLKLFISSEIGKVVHDNLDDGLLDQELLLAGTSGGEILLEGVLQEEGLDESQSKAVPLFRPGNVR